MIRTARRKDGILTNSATNFANTANVSSRFCRPAVAVACILWTGISANVAQAETDWHPARTWVFAVGVLEWQHHDIWPNMPGAKRQRRDTEFVQHFRNSGVPEGQIVYLQDRHATRKSIHDALKGQLAKTRPGDLHFFYYAGHGFRDRHTRKVYFANYDAADGGSAWPVRSIVDMLEQNFRGERALLMVDCCFSGGLAEEARRRKGRLEYACLCSSYSHNSSTGNWTFTECLLKGLRGDPAVDLDLDGQIELEELERYAELDMSFFEQQKATCTRTAKFPQRMKLAAATGKRQRGQGDRIEAEWKQQWYRAQIIDLRPGQVKIHYAGFANSWDEWIGPERHRPFQPQQLTSGTNVEVRWVEDEKWYPATVLHAWYGLYFVHYEGYPPEWNEWVRPDAVRQPHSKTQ